MKPDNKLFEAMHNMETISRRLGELSNLIETVHHGLQEERVEKQVLDCIICIDYSIKELICFTKESLEEINCPVIEGQMKY